MHWHLFTCLNFIGFLGVNVSDFCTSIIKKVDSEKPKLSEKLIKSFG